MVRIGKNAIYLFAVAKTVVPGVCFFVHDEFYGSHPQKGSVL